MTPANGELPVEIRSRDLLFTSLSFHLFEQKVRTIVTPTVGFFTVHGLSHIQGVDESVTELLNLPINGQCRPITQLEKLILRYCAWGHDLGMMESIAQAFRLTRKDKSPPSADTLRKNHDLASAWYLQTELPDLIKSFKRENLKVLVNNAELEPLIGKLRSDFRENELSDSQILSFFQSLREQDNDHTEAAAMNIASTVNLIAKYHRRSELIDDCPDERFLFGEVIRARLLAAIFRLADALHVDRTRFSKPLFDAIRVLPQFSEENRVHWVKSFIISNIRVDPLRYTVHIQADLPAENSGNTRRSNLFEEELLTFVQTDIEEDVLSVSQILLKAGFPPLLGVSREIHRIPAMPYWEQIRAALDTIFAAASPNTSQLLDITLAALAFRLTEANGESRDQAGSFHGSPMEVFLNREIQSQIKWMDDQLEKRPCHQALTKVAELLKAVLTCWATHNGNARLAGPIITLSQALRSKGELLRVLIDGVHQVFFNQHKHVKEKGFTGDEVQRLLGPYSDIIVYGYSQQVVGLLRHNVKSMKLRHIHVLECRTKCLYSSGGHLLYHDAERYAKTLAKTLDREKTKDEWIKIIIQPDAALGKIISNCSPKNTLILLGSNAVYTDGMCVHSLGHLSVACVAKTLGCRVVVVTDSSKIGYRPRVLQHPPPERQRNENVWLTHSQIVRDELKQEGIELKNWQEDSIPSNYIDDIIVLDKHRVLPQDRFAEELANYRFDPTKTFCSELEPRLLAAKIALERKGAFDEAIVEWLPKSFNDQNWDLANSFLTQPRDLPAIIKEQIEGFWQPSLVENVRILGEAFEEEVDKAGGTDCSPKAQVQ